MPSSETGATRPADPARRSPLQHAAIALAAPRRAAPSPGRRFAPGSCLDGGHAHRCGLDGAATQRWLLRGPGPSPAGLGLEAGAPGGARTKRRLSRARRAPAKHLSFQHLQAVDVSLDGTRAPGQGYTRFDCCIVFIPPDGEASPGLRLLAKACARSMAAATAAACARSWTSCGASAAVRWASRRRDEPGRPGWRQGLAHRCCHARQGPPRAALPRREALRLAQAAGIGRHRSRTSRVAALLDLTKSRMAV